MQRWTSDAMAVPRHAAAPFAHADLEFEDVEHDGASFVVHLFLNNPDPGNDPLTEAPGRAGHFTVFGHGDCWGDLGHCDVPKERPPFDTRAPHPLTPINVSVDVTAALKALPDAEEITVTALATSLGTDTNAQPLRFKRLTLVTYD